ncbi:hypothetical protein GCM10007207_17670 [Asaia siamensis]|uniref:Uncharacterized protein n=1 Tax=Asaia siamensis TaxID=110479 RepID=A0ABQ1M199_9PROT|nr:hypothetical protein AA0323_2704 [Asaia siamensis NRIC 0323]GGC32643.1 hypothetical protein GCM10007207_17670 [Asaia siamensis]
MSDMNWLTYEQMILCGPFFPRATAGTVLVTTASGVIRADTMLHESMFHIEP